MEGRWRIELLGWLRGNLGDVVVSRFRTRNAGVLLAYLALYKDRSHPREELGAMLWPEVDDTTMRARLRLALTSLRHQFEPPYLQKGSVLMAIGSNLQMNPQTVSTDVEEFEALLATADNVEDSTASREALEQAVALYRGEFLPGFYDEWVLAERQRLGDLLEGALIQLADLCAEQGLYQRGLAYARRLVALDPWQEERHCRVIQLFLQAENAPAALRQAKELRAMLAELGEEPSERTERLIERARNLTVSAEKAAPVASADAPVETPPTHGQVKSKLPVRLTRFFGRTDEINHVLRWLEEAPGRLVTLTGAGGCGKTRLSVEIGYAMDAFGWNVWFIPLADVGSSARLYDAILTGLKIGRSQDPLKDLARFFSQFEKPLLILDNFEHLMDDGALVVRELLSEIPSISCLVSSRQRLALEGERELTVPPLSAPSDLDVTPEQAARFPCVQLYVDRCQALRPDFQITERNAKAIANLCARLEGIPLAIEIASSLSQTLSPSQMADQLDKRLEVLVSPRRDIVERHRTLRNTIGYSYALLSPQLRRFFASLSVFRGGWTIRSASEVCLISEDCFSLLLQLRERSLVETYETSDGEMRFRMLETFREFGRDCLKQAEWDTLLARHDAYFLSLAEEAYRNLRTPNEESSLDALRADYDNLMSVFERALERRDAEFGIRLAMGFAQVWRSRGAVAREQAVIDGLVSLPEAQSLPPDLLMKGFNVLSHASFLLCDWNKSMEAEQRTLELASANSNHEYVAMSYGGLSTALGGLGRFEEAKEMMYKAVEHARLSGVEARVSLLLGNLGVANWREGDLVQAEMHFRESLALAEKTDQRAQANLLRLNIGRVLLDQGRYAEAIDAMSDCLERSTKLHRAHDVVMALTVLARYYRLTGELGRAVALSHLALEKVFGLMNENSEVYLAVEMGQQLAEQGQFRDAAVVLSSLGRSSLSKVDARDVEKALDRCKAELPSSEFDRCWARGVAGTVADALHTLALVA